MTVPNAIEQGREAVARRAWPRAFRAFARAAVVTAATRSWWPSPASGAGFAPPAGARRMAQSAAHLVDRVIPRVPVRQWVLSFPIPLRILLAAHPDLLSPLLQCVHRVIATFLIKQSGLQRSQAHSGAVTLIQRFGSAANLNIHLHCLVLDGVYCTSEGEPVLHEVRAPSMDELHTLLGRIIQRIVKLLTRTGYLIEEQGVRYLAEADSDCALTPLQAAACTYRIALGPRAGQKVLSLQTVPSRAADSQQPGCVNAHGFSLHAAVRCGAHQRKQLERLCRYITRPAIANERLKRNRAGQVVLQLKSPWRDGTTHIVMSPLDFMQRLSGTGPAPAAASDSLPWRARSPRQLKGPDRSERAAQRPSGLRSPRPDPTRLSAAAHELGVLAQTGIRSRCRTLHKLWRAPEDHRRDGRSRGDYQDPHPSAPAGARTAQITGAACRSVPSGLIAHSSSPAIGLSP